MQKKEEKDDIKNQREKEKTFNLYTTDKLDLEAFK